MEHKIILKCRTCLEDNEEDSMFELFVENDITVNGRQKKLKLSKKIEYCCGVRVSVCWNLYSLNLKFEHSRLESQPICHPRFAGNVSK